MSLLEWIAKHGLTQREVAARVGVTQGRISQICNGGTDSLKLAERIVALTGGEVSIAELRMVSARAEATP